MKEQKVFINLMNIFWLILCESLNATSDNLTTTRIAGGNRIEIKEAKFVVQVITKQQNGMYGMCGGSLVTAMHVITAAHCVGDVRCSDITVIGGATYFNRGGLRREVAAKYMPESLSWDVVVLRLKTALAGHNVETIKLCSTQWQTGDLFKVFGWGMHHEREELNKPKRAFNLEAKFFTMRQLQVVEVPVVDQIKCMLHYKSIIPGYLFCAGQPGQKDACSGDSGGPAVFNNELCGIVSAGARCPDIGLYVDINYVKSFIDKYIVTENVRGLSNKNL